MTITDQIADELGQVASALGAILGPDVLIDLERRVSQVAPILAVQLAQDDDDRLAAQTVIDLMAVLGDRDDNWYLTTPLGRAVARSAAGLPTDAMSFARAAAALGVSRSRIQQFVGEGRIDRHPDGGLSAASVLALAVQRAD